MSDAGLASISAGVPCATIRPPCTPAPGPEIDDVIRRADRILVVLDDDHRVADVAQAMQRVEQALVVALVQADRRLVQDVHDAHQSRADLAREPDALGFAAGKRLGAAVERQVVEPDVDQEAAAGR